MAVDPNETYSPGAGGSSTSSDAFDGPLGRSVHDPGPTTEEHAKTLRSRYGPYGYSYAGTAPPVAFYRAGDEWKPLNTPQNVPEILKKLVAAGLLDPNDYRPGAQGAWDEKAAAAYREVLTMANRYDVGAGEMLDQLAANPDMKTLQGGAGAAAPPIGLTHPTELRESFRSAYRERVGKNPSQAAMDSFVDTYHKMEESAGHAMNDAAPGATFIQAPPQADAARAEIDKNNNADEHAYQTITRLHDFYSMLDSPVQ